MNRQKRDECTPFCVCCIKEPAVEINMDPCLEGVFVRAMGSAGICRDVQLEVLKFFIKEWENEI